MVRHLFPCRKAWTDCLYGTYCGGGIFLYVTDQIIQPPIMKMFTTEKERKIKMDQLRPVSKLEKILFPNRNHNRSLPDPSYNSSAGRYADAW